MSKEKQISEMAYIVARTDDTCKASSIALALYGAGYRKQKEGEWIFRNDGAYGRTRCYCSACGKHSGIGGIRENQLKPFCPNCGAHMRKEDEGK